MRALLVGADRLGNIPEVLAAYGIDVVGHVTGRNAAHQRRLPEVSRQTDVMILFTDFLGHNVMKHFRSMADRQGIQVLACRRSASCLVKSLAGLNRGGCEECRKDRGLTAGRA
jgi:hypothetical protein